MLTTLFKKIEIFQPYNIPIQPLIISKIEKKLPQDIKNENNANELNSSPKKVDPNLTENDNHQNETLSSTGEFDKNNEKNIFSSFKTFTCLLSKKRKNSNLVKCSKCNIDDCESLFETKEELDKHKLTHDKIYKCSHEGCQMKFMHEKNLQKHCKVHCILIKNYKCPFPGCDKRFTALYNQKIHYRVHTGERPYKCNICGNNYYDRANYKYHIKTAHNIVDKNEVICSHGGFCHEFKTKKQKIMHHDKLEKSCRNEKNYIIKLIYNYEKAINYLKNQNDDLSLEEYDEYKEVKTQKNKVEKITADKDFFDSLFSANINL
jgi:uncharacterized Zn-finger protein